MDCIELVPIATPIERQTDTLLSATACIRCGRCQEICPERLQPDLLWWVSRSPQATTASRHGLDSCIECGLCNQVCPSSIDLVGVFQNAKAALAKQDATQHTAHRARLHHEQHEARLVRERLIATDKRGRRMGAGKRTW